MWYGLKWIITICIFWIDNNYLFDMTPFKLFNQLFYFQLLSLQLSLSFNCCVSPLHHTCMPMPCGVSWVPSFTSPM